MYTIHNAQSSSWMCNTVNTVERRSFLNGFVRNVTCLAVKRGQIIVFVRFLPKHSGIMARHPDPTLPSFRICSQMLKWCCHQLQMTWKFCLTANRMPPIMQCWHSSSAPAVISKLSAAFTMRNTCWTISNHTHAYFYSAVAFTIKWIGEIFK